MPQEYYAVYFANPGLLGTEISDVLPGICWSFSPNLEVTAASTPLTSSITMTFTFHNVSISSFAQHLMMVDLGVKSSIVRVILASNEWQGICVDGLDSSHSSWLCGISLIIFVGVGLGISLVYANGNLFKWLDLATSASVLLNR